MLIEIEDGTTIQIGYVWDKSDKYLVLVDNTNKTKYIIDTYKSTFSEHDVDSVIWKFIEYTKNTKLQEITFKIKSKGVNRICHNDDFCDHYKKNYKIVNPTECRKLGLDY